MPSIAPLYFNQLKFIAHVKIKQMFSPPKTEKNPQVVPVGFKQTDGSDLLGLHAVTLVESLNSSG